MIRVANRFLSGATNPADGRWCNAQLDANTLTPADGIGPGGSVKLPTQGDAGTGMVQLAMARPGLAAMYSKHDVSGAFRLLWLTIQLCGLFAPSVPRWFLGRATAIFTVCSWRSRSALQFRRGTSTTSQRRSPWPTRLSLHRIRRAMACSRS